MTDAASCQERIVMNYPAHPGIYVVTGQRRWSNGHRVQHSGEVCQVLWTQRGRTTLLGVVFLGRETVYPLSEFEAQFTPVEIAA